MNRLDAQDDRLRTSQVKVEDTDYTATISTFSTAQTVYQAALEVGTRSRQPSLLDYVR